jgi:DNA primase
MWDKAPAVDGTPGAQYLQARGITADVARTAGVRYVDRWPHWVTDGEGGWQLEGTSRRVVFPIVDQAGELVGIQGRAIDAAHHGEKIVTRGSGGVFCSTGTFADVSASQCVVIVEAPIDALSLATASVRPVLATCGTSVPDWLPRALAFKQVVLGHDNDEPDRVGERAGDVAAMKAAPVFRSFGAIVERWRPALKDWNDVLLRYSAEVLRHELADDQVDQVDQSASTTTQQDIDDVAQVDNGVANHVLANPEMTDPGWIEIRDPVTGERFEIEAASCPPSWRASDTKETYQRQLWGHPP